MLIKEGGSVMSNGQKVIETNKNELDEIDLSKTNISPLVNSLENSTREFSKINDFEELYKIKEDALEGWQTALNYKLLCLAQEKNASFEQIKDMFYDYYFRKYPKNRTSQRVLHWLNKNIQLTGKNLAITIGLVVTVFPLYQFWQQMDMQNKSLEVQNVQLELQTKQLELQTKAQEEQNKIYRENTARESWNIIASYQDKPGDLGRSQVIQYLKELHEKDENKKGKFKLHSINLNKAALPGIDLSNTQLNYAFFNEAKLKKANFENANLEEAEFKDAILTEADFTGAVLFRANFTKSNEGKGTLNQAKFNEAELDRSIFTNAQLEQAKFHNAELYHVNFRYAYLMKADFSDAKLGSADFANADLTSVTFNNETDIQKANFSNAKGLSLEQLKKAKNWRFATYSEDFLREVCVQQEKPIQCN